MKKNLPVILLRGITLLPNNEIRLEFDNTVSKEVLETAELFHNNYLLVVSQNNPLEEVPKIYELPKLGVVSKIIEKYVLPNGFIRVVIKGLKRAQVLEYLYLQNNNDILESIISEIEENQEQDEETIVFLHKLREDIENYIKVNPYINTHLLDEINKINDLSFLTDVIVPYLPLSDERVKQYLHSIDPKIRAMMLLEDINNNIKFSNIERSIDQKVKKELDTNQKEYILREKIKKIKEELGDISAKDDEIEELRVKTEELESPAHIKERLELELRRYERLQDSSPEANIIRNYIDWLLNLPWLVNTQDNNNLVDVKNKLDSSHYGLDKVKERIIEYLAVKQMTKSLKSPILCLVGPPGVGKTSLAFSIAKSINRNFVKISVGGVHDEAEIIGHRRAYIGSSPGRIIQSLKKAKSSNPVFLIDEIDKMTKDFKGDPASALLEILDPEQNKYFSDNYIEEEFDLSNVMFIATANYIENIPEALKDRLEIIRLSGYTEYEKLDIAKKHLLPKICKDHGIEKEKVIISNNILLTIIRNYTKESGVRELERQLSTIIRKIVSEIVVNNISKEVYQIKRNELIKYLGKPKYNLQKLIGISNVGVVNGLAYTYFGGDTLPIEVNYYKGSGKLVLTGSLGEVMKESANIALSYIKSNYKYYGIDYNKLIDNDIHIHVPEGAIPKDGPSAGITLTTALISALTNKKVPANIAMTGEITLRGAVLPIGGLKEKSIGANRNGINKIIIPYDNLKDLDDIPEEIKTKIEYIPVKNYREVIEVINDAKIAV